MFHPIDLLLWVREWTTVWLPWPMKGQWPPGKPIYVQYVSANDGDSDLYIVMDEPTEGFKAYDPEDRVADVGRDTLGYSVGQTLRFVGLVAWGIWG